jgi:hypothetical protein
VAVAAPAGATAPLGCPTQYNVARGANPDFHAGGAAGTYIMLDGSSNNFLNWTVGVTSPRVKQPNGQLRATTFIGEMKSDAPFTFVAINLEPAHGSDVIKQSTDGKTIDFWFTNYSGEDSFTVSNNCSSTFMTFDKLSINGPSNPTPGSQVFVGSNSRHPFGLGEGTLYSFPRYPEK